MPVSLFYMFQKKMVLQQSKINRVVREIFSTEMSYRDSLVTLVDKFQKPLLDAHKVGD